MTELGRGVDELQVDLLQGAAVRLHQQRLRTQHRGSMRVSNVPRTAPEMIVPNASRRVKPVPYLAQGEHPLLDADGAALQHEEVVPHLAVVHEATLQGIHGRGVSHTYLPQLSPI